MDMDFSKDIETFRIKGFKGISWTSMFLGILTVIVGSLIIGLCSALHIPMIAGVYISVPFLYPIVMLGFTKKNGYTTLEVIRRKRQIAGYTKTRLRYASSEKCLYEEVKGAQNEKKEG